MGVPVHIPGADSIDVPAPARDPGVRADASDFGADIGAGAEHFGNALVSLSAHLYNKQQEAADRVAVDRATVEAPAVVQKTIFDTQQQFPEGGPQVTDALKTNLRTNLEQLRKQQSESGLTLSPKAQAEVDHHFSGLTSSALVTGTTYGANQRIKALGDHFDDSIKEIGAQALSDPAAIDTHLAALDKSANAYQGIIPKLALDDKLDKAKKATVQAAIDGLQAAGKIDEAQALRARFFGGVPQSMTSDYEKSLTRSESGGKANLINPLGYAGTYQFGAPRVADLGVYTPGSGEDMATWSKSSKDAPGKWSGTFNIPGFPQIKTINDFAATPAAQKAVFDLHTSRSDKDAEKAGLNDYIGEEVGGTTITKDGIRAMIHLGGVGGAQKFLESGGKYNPADANGTKLSDYARLGARSGGAPELPDAVLAIRNYDSLNSSKSVQSAKYQDLIKNDISSITNTGQGNNALSPPDVAGAVGQDEAAKWLAARAKAQEFWTKTQAYYTQTPAEISASLAAMAPKAGTADFIEQSHTYAAATKVAAAAMKQRTDDPAAYSAGYMPAVMTAATKMNAAEAGQDDAAKKAARSDYAVAQLAEQSRLGIPADQQKILPQPYIENFQNKLNNPSANGGAGNIAAQIQNEAAMWGDKWPLVYRQLSKELEPAALVIGSGIKPQAAQKLAELANTKYGDIVKDEDTEKSATIKKETLDAFKPLAESMVGNEGSTRVFNDFLGQGQKLAAYYVTRGQSASQAAAKAYDDLIGHKYEVRDGYRIPKALPYTANDIQSGAVSARFDLPKMNILPEVDNFGGLGKDYLKDQTIKAYQRDGKWVNAPDESGLMLVYADAAVRKTDGKPVIISWDDLGNRGKAISAIKPDPFSGVQP
jgi:hypothetical protein